MSRRYSLLRLSSLTRTAFLHHGVPHQTRETTGGGGKWMQPSVSTTPTSVPIRDAMRDDETENVEAVRAAHNNNDALAKAGVKATRN
jgi:hypothetical protein